MGRGLLLAVAIAGVLGPAPARAETLAEALQNTLATNAQLDAARAELRAVREELDQAKGGWLPRLEGLLGSAYNDINSSLRAERFLTSRAGLQLSQNVFQGGGTVAAVAVAENQIVRQQALLATTEQDLLLNAVEVYTAVLRDQRILDASIENVRRLEIQLDATQKRFDVGEATRTDLAQSEARLIGARADVVQSRANLAEAIAVFERIVGFRPETLTAAPLPDALPEDLAAALARAGTTNPRLRAALARLAQAEAEADVAFARLLPSVDVEGELSYVDEPSIFTEWQRDASIGVAVTVPLYQQGVARSQLRQARELVAQRRREVEEVRRQVDEGVLRAVERLRAAEGRVGFFRDQVAAYERALDGIEREAQIGNRSIIDVLDAEQDLFVARVSLERAVRDRAAAAYGLKNAVGELGAADLGLSPVDEATPRGAEATSDLFPVFTASEP